MKGILLGALLALGAPVAQAAQQRFECGGARVEIDMFSGAVPHTWVRVSRDVRYVQMLLQDAEFLGGRYQQDSQGRPKVVFQAFCGGSGCEDLHNWGIIDPLKMQTLLAPAPGNALRASEVLGFCPTPLEFRELMSLDHEARLRGIPEISG
ncbi:hypothetical protein [Pseudomonas knackmussii]|uniref:hypothetical protein n=1 Tax=Pseudomonas knackmussii TaxID=65741 RepID=UPI001362575F|nr:hypothetical protein [Pseudomonas knackmussii]